MASEASLGQVSLVAEPKIQLQHCGLLRNWDGIAMLLAGATVCVRLLATEKQRKWKRPMLCCVILKHNVEVSIQTHFFLNM